MQAPPPRPYILSAPPPHHSSSPPPRHSNDLRRSPSPNCGPDPHLGPLHRILASVRPVRSVERPTEQSRNLSVHPSPYVLFPVAFCICGPSNLFISQTAQHLPLAFVPLSSPLPHPYVLSTYPRASPYSHQIPTTGDSSPFGETQLVP